MCGTSPSFALLTWRGRCCHSCCAISEDCAVQSEGGVLHILEAAREQHFTLKWFGSELI